MRTAEEWYRKINSHSFPEYMNDVHRDWVMKMINEARKEAIEECYNRASKLWGVGKKTGESILNLINELK